MGLIQTGRVTGGEIKKNKDGEKNVLILQVEITEPDDVQSIQLMKQAGEDTNPPDGSTVTILSIGNAFKIAVASDDGIEPSMSKGEKKIYSSADGTIQAFIDLLASGDIELDAAGAANIKILENGDIELNDNTDFAVRYNALAIAFNQLKMEFNSHIVNYNLHKQLVIFDPILLADAAQPPITPSIPSTANIAPAQILNIKVPGV